MSKRFLCLILISFLSIPAFAVSTGDEYGGRTLHGEYSYYGWYQTVAAGDGQWTDIRAVRSASIHVTALATGDSFTVQVSNSATIPANTTDGVIDQTITGDGSEKFVSVTKLPARWLKIDKIGSTATATALLHGLSR